MPRVSVLMPVYNTERYVRQAVESILRQTFEDFELLALDDGSTDKSLSILRELETQDRRMRVTTRENRGIVPTRNELVMLAEGQYVALMDSDDISRAKRFEKQVQYLDENPGCVAVGSRSLIVDADGLPIMESMNELTHHDLDGAHLSDPYESRMVNSSVMLRRSLVIQAGMFREEYSFAEDFDLYLRLAEIGELANLPDILLEYRLHLSSICHTRAQDTHDASRRAVSSAYLRRGITLIPNFREVVPIPRTKAEEHRKWAWWALAGGNLATARKHKRFKQSPQNHFTKRT